MFKFSNDIIRLVCSIYAVYNLLIVHMLTLDMLNIGPKQTCTKDAWQIHFNWLYISSRLNAMYVGGKIKPENVRQMKHQPKKLLSKIILRYKRISVYKLLDKVHVIVIQ